MNRSSTVTTMVAGAVACAALAASAPSAYSFGTLTDKFGQRAEHERITRAALACPHGKASDNYCFEPDSLSELAGARGKGGAIGAPDLGREVFRQEAHCDNADYLAQSGYPQSRADASKHLLGCVDHARERMENAATEAARLLNGKGAVDSKQVGLSVRCVFNQSRGRAKCDAIEQFGRGLHAVQDFYSHSNWADQAGSGPISVTNPPGRRRTDLFPLFRLFSGSRPTPGDVPQDLTTGCFDEEAAGSGEKRGCSHGKRIRHHALNKDLGLIDPATGHTSDPRTDRGRIGTNFSAAVTLAIADTRRQWRDLVHALEQRYPGGKGARMACAITHDHPTKDCR
ncbi:CinY protein [Actinomadura logoneensis]|uniref:CinY protein n=1 Tax=Actinomadura logoneensis TaxID=2293572 RepID=A0A372JJE5_9ACTN|nr:CinY protein [Actinomadura logoneensis]RFU39936.1 CinY protein [Actinomadura logoneensis]